MGITRNRISGITGLSKPTVTEIINYLSGLGLLTEKEKVSTAGRLTPHFYLEAESYRFIGLGLYRSRVIGVLCNILGKIESDFHFTVTGEMGIPEIFPRIVTELDVLVKASLQAGKHILGIGVGVPGVIDKSENRIVQVTDFEGLSDFNFMELLHKTYEIPVFIQHNINLAAFSECRNGVGQGKDCFIYISLGEGVGCSIFHLGHMMNGDMNFQGEIGHFSIDINGPQCECGGHGCLELYVKRSILTHSIETEPGQREQILREAASRIAQVVANVICLTGIRTTIIGGSTLIHYPELFEMLKDIIPKEVLPSISTPLEIVSTPFNIDASAPGAALYVAEITQYNLEEFFGTGKLKNPFRLKGLL